MQIPQECKTWFQVTRLYVQFLRTFRPDRKTYSIETTHEKYKNIYVLILHKDYFGLYNL
jgi:hypothetical protein